MRVDQTGEDTIIANVDRIRRRVTLDLDDRIGAKVDRQAAVFNRLAFPGPNPLSPIRNCFISCV